MATSEQLEREAEATRAQIAATLDELRGRMTTGQIVDQLVDYARDSGGGEFARNFGRQVVGNPIPVALVGAGIAWLMMAGRSVPSDDIAAGMSEAGRRREAGGRSSAAARRAREWAQQTRDTAAQLNQGAADVGASLQESASAAGNAVRDSASAAYDTASSTYAAAADTASSAYAAAAECSRQGADAIARGASRISDRVATSGQGILTLLQEQPLVLAGLGLAIGSLLGAALPMTDAEDELMGEASDAAKSEAKARAAEQVEKGKAVAAEAWHAAKPEVAAEVGRDADRQRAGSAGQASVATEAGQAATLVPSDHGGPTDSGPDSVPGEAAHRTG
jgi:hypothetical protein